MIALRFLWGGAVAGNFRLGPWLVEPSLNSVTRRDLSIHLTPKVMAVLVCLAEHAGDTVNKEVLFETVWPDTFVGDDVLKGYISDLRRVLEDDAREPKIIQTIPKSGYRLVAQVEWIKGTESSTHGLEKDHEPARNHRKLRMAALAVIFAAVPFVVVLSNVGRVRSWLISSATAPQIHSLAVLPLRSLSSDPNQEYLSDGLTDALITDLAQIGSIKVISHTSTMQYKNTKKPLPEIARELNVDGIVEGAVQRSGDRVRITAQLIYGPGDKHLWANSYDRDMGDIFALERDVTEEISRQVQARLVTKNQAPLTRPRPVNPKALDAYLEGNYHMHCVAHGSIDEELTKAADYFQQAINAAPDFAPAYVGFSDAIGSHMRNSVDNATASRKAAEKAVELDPTSSDARAAVAAFKLFYSLDWPGAEEQSRRAVALNANSADAHDGLSQFLYAVGRVDEGWRESQIAQELDPNQDRLSKGLLFRRDYDRAIEVLQKTLERHPDDGDAYGSLSEAYSLKGLQSEAIRALDRSVTLYGFPGVAARVERAFSTSGYDAAVRLFASELEHLNATKQAFLPGSTASIYALVGDKDRAFYWLEQAYQHREIIGREAGLVFLKVDPAMDSLRSDPRFDDLIRRVGLPP